MSTQTNFQQWLLAKDIDVQALDRQLRAALIRQYRQERLRLMPPVTRLVVPMVCQWPQRCFRTQVVA